jgi:hypothetical protein
MSDVTAVVLSIGENYTERAIASVQRQTLPVAETIVVRGLSPFHRAFNNGSACVRTEFFIQVDADMILDDTCIADLRSCVSDEVGIVVGHLRDPLLGRTLGIKLFRTQCCNRVKLRDCVSCETDFVEELQREGWVRIYALKHAGESPLGWHVFGEHRPDYTPSYTFAKYVREGAKARYRKAKGGLRSQFRRLYTNGHDAALIATIAAAHGIFVTTARDIHEPDVHNEEFECLSRFFTSQEVAKDASVVQGTLGQGDLQEGFKRAYALGIQLRQQQAPATFTSYIRQLQQADDTHSWVALIGLCQGLFVDEYREAEAEQALALLREFLAG